MKNILISGAAGFLGCHLTELYLNKGYKVYGIDNLSTGDYSNIEDFIKNKKFEFIKHDITEKFNFNKKIDYILHFASPASPSDYLKFPIQTLRVGSHGTENMLNLAKKNNSRILVASTSEVYGDPLQHPQHENYYGNVNPIGPRGVYDEAKRYLEAMTYAYLRNNKINTGIVRIFNTFGPKMRIDDGRAIPNFLVQLIKNEKFTVYGDGEQTRSFSYVSDTIKGIDKLLFSNLNQPINIGNPNEITLLNLIYLIRNLKENKCEIEFTSLPENDPIRRKPDISLAKKLLDWKPEVNIELGLKLTFNFFQKKLTSFN